MQYKILKRGVIKLNVLSVFFYTIVLTSTQVYAQSQQLNFEHLSVAEGLSQSTVFAIMQDSKGFMWFGTRTGGLNKYDGNSFKVYKNNSDDPKSISGNEILAIFEDSKGRIWIGTRSFGINRFDYKTGYFNHYLNITTPNDDPGFRNVHGVVEDYKGRIWLATQGGVCVFDEINDEFVECLNEETGEPYSSSSSLCLVNDSTICFGTKKGAIIFNTNSRKQIKHFAHDENDSTSINSNNITAVHYDINGRLWIGTRHNGLNRLENLDSDHFTHIKQDNNNQEGLIYNVIRTIYGDSKGTIWIGTSLGLEQLIEKEQGQEHPKFIHYQNDLNNAKSLSQNVALSFCEDSWGNYWIGTWSKGVNYVNVFSKKIDHYKNNKDEELSLGNDNVTCFSENELGIWIGTDGGGLSLFNPELKRFTQHFSKDYDTPIIESDKIRSVFADTDGSVWIGTFKGLVQYFPSTGELKSVFRGHVINHIAKGIDDELWFGGGKGLIKYHKSDGSYTEYKKKKSDTSSIAGNKCNYLYLDNNKELWVGTGNGLHQYNREADNFIRYQYSPVNKTSLSNDNVITIVNDLSGDLWIGTYDGLNKFDPTTQSFTRYSENNGLSDNVINGMLCDEKNKLWLSTNKGIETFYLENESDTSVPVVRLYTKEDGLQGSEFIRHSYLKTESGEFLFGGTQGFNIFHPDSIKDNPQEPKIVFTEFMLFHKQVRINDNSNLLSEHISSTKYIALSHKQSVIGFSFSALSYASPQKNQYAFIMEGFEENWNYVGNTHEATYTNLPPGKYTFRVKASNNDGVWNEEGAAISIKMRTPWYKTTLFYILFFIGLAFSIYSLIRAREKQQKIDQKRLEDQLEQGKKEIENQTQQVEKQAKDLKTKEENEVAMKWHSRGYINFSNIINENRGDLDKLANEVIFEMVQYLKAFVGAIYYTHDGYLELKGGYALDDRRIEQTEIQKGEGLVGSCYAQKKVLRINDLPPNYASIVSGLGEIELNYLVLIPILYNDNAEGVIEIISNENIDENKIKLVEAVCSILGAALLNEKANHKISQLRNENQQQLDLLSSSNEELLQNREECAASREESARNERKLQEKVKALRAKLQTVDNGNAE